MARTNSFSICIYAVPINKSGYIKHIEDVECHNVYACI